MVVSSDQSCLQGFKLALISESISLPVPVPSYDVSPNWTNYAMVALGTFILASKQPVEVEHCRAVNNHQGVMIMIRQN